MSSDEYTKLADWLMQIEKRLEKVEGASPLRANSEQPLVGPPDKFEERPAALARPVTLSEVVSFVEEEFQMYINFAKSDDEVQFMSSLKKSILQQLGTLDQGPIASSHTKVEFVTDVASTNTSSLKQ